MTRQPSRKTSRQTSQKTRKKASGRKTAPAASTSSASLSSTDQNTPEGNEAAAPGPAPVSPPNSGPDSGPGPAKGPGGFDPGLYLVATPIGNARDITLRALDLLAAADVIACEDTRTTAKLLAIHGIRAPLLAYHDHNAARQGPKIIKRLKAGEIVALVSDAGTPLVSDPGFGLAQAVQAAGLPVTALPGASSVLNGLLLSGLPSDRFFFQGFLAPRSAARKTMLGEIAAVPATLIFLESPKRLAASLADMADVLGPRPAAVLREMTKKFEEARRDTLPALAAHYAEAGAPRGEVVVAVAPPDKNAARPDDAALDTMIRDALATLSVRDAAAHVATATGIRKQDIYARALKLAKAGGTGSGTGGGAGSGKGKTP